MGSVYLELTDESDQRPWALAIQIVEEQDLGAAPNDTPFSKHVHCPVCFDLVPISSTVALHACGHRFCRVCIAGYLEVKICDGEVFPMCFHEEVEARHGRTVAVEKLVKCGKRISSKEIEALVSKEMFAKYNTYKFYRENKSGRQCPNCEHFQVCFGEAQPIETCERCGKEFCFLHANAHENRTCADYTKEQRKNDQLTATLVSATTKPCPRCSIPIEKESGCNQMQCPWCQIYFCWLCGIELDGCGEGHFVPWSSSPCAGLLHVNLNDQTLFKRFVRRMVWLINLLVIGSITAVLVLASTALFCFFIPCKCMCKTSFRASLRECAVLCWLLVTLIPHTLIDIIRNLRERYARCKGRRNRVSTSSEIAAEAA